MPTRSGRTSWWWYEHLVIPVPGGPWLPDGVPDRSHNCTLAILTIGEAASAVSPFCLLGCGIENKRLVLVRLQQKNKGGGWCGGLAGY